MLGHAKASMTLDIYADLCDEDLDGVADRLDSASDLCGPVADWPVSDQVSQLPARWRLRWCFFGGAKGIRTPYGTCGNRL